MKKLFLCCSILMATTVIAQRFDKFAHRGGRGLMPENTIIAMQNAMDFGVALEMDLYLSKDNRVFVYHDGTISPVFATNPDGSVVTKEQSARQPVIDYNYRELSAFDIGTRFNPEFPRKKEVKAHIPLFSELVDSVEAYAKRGGLPPPVYCPEMKYMSKGMPPSYREHLVDAAMKIIHDRKIDNRVIIQSFDVDILEYLHKKYPQIKTLYLVFVGKGSYVENLRKLSFKPYAYSPYYKQVTPEVIAHCHKEGIKVITWTVNTRAEIEQLRVMKVDGIMSDYPDYFNTVPMNK